MKPVNSVVDLAARGVSRLDSWANALTGLGEALRDKLVSTRFVDGPGLTEELVEALYHQEDMAARVCEALPEDSLRRGYSISVEGEEESEIPGEAFEYEKTLGFRRHLLEAAVWSRVFGGAVVYLGVDDGLEENQPVNEKAVKGISFAMVLTKRELEVKEYYSNPKEDGKFGQPRMYRIRSMPLLNPAEGSVTLNQEIHETRLIRLNGARTSTRRQQRNKGWHDSVLNKVHDTLVQFNVGWQSTSSLLQDAAQGVFKLEGLIDMIAAGDKEALQARMEVVEMGRSVARSIMLDAEMEEYHREAYSFAGVPQVLQAFMLRLAAAARMPVTLLMGQSPKGLNATGDNDTRMWYDRIEGYQSDQLLPAIERFYHLMFLAKDFPAKEPPKWAVLFAKLWQLSDVEQADLEKKVSEKDKVYIEQQVLLPEEVALNRFKAGGFSMETQIDIKARKEMLEVEIKLVKEQAGEDPLDAVEPGAPPGSPPAAEGGGQAKPTPKDT